MAGRRPNILVILTDQQRHLPVYESDEVRRFCRETLVAEETLRASGISFERHYIMSSACTPSRASLLTGQYPSLHGVTQTDGLAKSADGEEMFWLAPDAVPTMADWFRAGGYRTFYKGKWHASHAHLDALDGKGYLQSLDDSCNPIPENIASYLEADLLDEYGFSEWVGPEAHGLGKQHTGTARDPFTADETIALLKRLDRDGSTQPWLAVCSLLNPHDIAMFGVIALAQGLRYDNGSVTARSRRAEARRGPIHQARVPAELRRRMGKDPGAAALDRDAPTFLLPAATHGRRADRAGARRPPGDRRLREHDRAPDLGPRRHARRTRRNAPEVAQRLRGDRPRPVRRVQPSLPGRATRGRHPHEPRRPPAHAGIDHDEALGRIAADHPGARPLVGRDPSGLIRGVSRPPADPVLVVTEDEISEGSAKPGSPFQRWARKVGTYETVVQPNHIETVVARVEVDGERHLAKLSRYHDNMQFWTVPGQRDERLRRGNKIVTVTEPTPDEYELYDLTSDPLEQRNLAHPRNADGRSRELLERMLRLLVEQLAAKRLVPASGEVPGYRPPMKE